MAKSLVTNVSQSPITLPPPYIGIIPPGVSVVIDQPTSEVIAAVYAVPSVARFITIAETSNASRTTISVSTATAAAATEVVVAEITGPLNLNGQRAINSGAPLDATDLATKAYVDAHGGSGGTVTAVTAAAPLASTGGATPEISLNDSGAVAGTYGDPAASPEAVTPVVTVTAKGLLSNVTTGAIKIGGSAAKAYVDAGDAATLLAANTFAESLAFGISSKDSVHTATTAPLPANTPDGAFQILTANANGLLPDIGGHSLTVGQRVLVKSEAAQVNNGIYVVTSIGADDPGGSPWVLTRASDANTAGELCGSMVPVETGALANTVWLFAANSSTFVFGTTPVIWTELSVGAATTTSLGTVVLGAGLGGAGTSASLPKLDMAHASSGTLARERGGTGLAVAGAAGNVLTSNGTDWASSPIPDVSIARTYFVATNGSDSPGNGSLSKPFATIGAAQTQATADLLATEYAKIVVGPGTYTGNVTLRRVRTIIEGAGNRFETYATKLVGQILVNPTAGADKFQDVIAISGFFVEPPSSTTGTDAPAVRFFGGNLWQFVATDCYFTTSSPDPDAIAITDTTINVSRPRVFLQDCFISVQANQPSSIISLTNADARIFRCQVAHSSAVTGGKIGVALSTAATLWADSTIFETTSGSSPVLSVGGTLPAGAQSKVMVSNSSITNALNNSGIMVSSNVPIFVYQTSFSIPSGAARAISSSGTVIYSALTFLPGTQTTIFGTLAPASETLGALLLPSLGAGALVKNTATGAVAVVAPTVPGNVLTANGTAWVSAPPAVNTADFGLVNAPGGPYPGIPASSLVAVVNGTVVLADAFSGSTAPVSGIYTGSVTNQIRTSGKQSGFVGLPANSKLYLAVGGGFSATPPLVSSGRVCQAVGYSIGTTELFVQLEDEIVYS